MTSVSVNGKVYCSEYPACRRTPVKGFYKCRDCLSHSVQSACNPFYEGHYSLSARQMEERRRDDLPG